MATGESTDRNDIVINTLSKSPTIFRESLANLDRCRRLCSDLGCDSSWVSEIDADQQQLAKHSAILAKGVFSVWTPGYIKLYKKKWWRLKRTSEKKKDAIRTQAEELSGAFKEIGKRVRDHAHATAKEKAEDYREQSEKAAVEAEKQRNTMNEASQVAERETEKSNEKSGLCRKLRIAALSTVLLPPLALGLFIGSKVASEQGKNAGERAAVANRTVEIARSAKQNAECRQDNFQELSNRVSQAQEYLGELEELCNIAAAFLQSEADKFHSTATNMDAEYELRLEKEVAEEVIPILERRGEAFENFYQAMDLIGSNYIAVVRPHSYPPITLPSFDLTLHN